MVCTEFVERVIIVCLVNSHCMLWYMYANEMKIFRPNSKAATEREQVGSAQVSKRESEYSRFRFQKGKLIGKKGRLAKNREGGTR